MVNVSLKNFNPITPSLRSLVSVSRSLLSRSSPYKPLLSSMKSSGGRNSYGRITTRHRGGGSKRRYRIIDFKFSSFTNAVVQTLEYDPNRTSFIALVRDLSTGSFSYIPAVDGVRRGSVVNSSDDSLPESGNSLLLKKVPIGSLVSCLEIKPGRGAQICRSAGCSARIMGRMGDYVLVKLPSGITMKLLSSCRALVGSISNPDHKNIKLGKAGKNRWLGFRPAVRGVAMNPIDHPHGGGEGRTSGGRHPVSPWGVPTKGYKTVKKSQKNKKRRVNNA